MYLFFKLFLFLMTCIIRKTKNSSFKNEKSKKEVDVTITVSNKDIVKYRLRYLNDIFFSNYKRSILLVFFWRFDWLK